jgi:hypothetical protein
MTTRTEYRILGGANRPAETPVWPVQGNVAALSVSGQPHIDLPLAFPDTCLTLEDWSPRVPASGSTLVLPHHTEDASIRQLNVGT